MTSLAQTSVCKPFVPQKSLSRSLWRLRAKIKGRDADEGLEVVFWLLPLSCYPVAFRRATSSIQRIRRVKAQTAVTSGGRDERAFQTQRSSGHAALLHPFIPMGRGTERRPERRGARHSAESSGDLRSNNVQRHLNFITPILVWRTETAKIKNYDITGPKQNKNTSAN